MNLLKYLDILIALAVVMVLLSPMVTAITQLWMATLNRRATFLLDAIARLIQHVDGHSAVVVEIHDPKGAAVAGAKIGNLGTTAAGSADLWVPGGLPSVPAGVNTLKVPCTDAKGAALHKHELIMRFIPQRTRDNEVVVAAAADAEGKTVVSYAHAGSAACASWRANVTVCDRAGALAPGTLTCLVQGFPAMTLTAVATGKYVFTYPGSPNSAPPGAYDVKCTMVDANNVAVAGCVISFEFLRNADHDLLAKAITDHDGVATVAAPDMITGELSRALAAAVLEHPMVARVRGRFSPRVLWKRGLGEVVEREELIRILLELAANEGAGADFTPREMKNAERGQVRDALRNALRMNGIPNPAKALADIRAAAQSLEKEDPKTAAHVRQAKAILQAAASDFVGKINNWFDQAMQRVTQRYAVEARMVTVGAAFIVAVAVQLDSIDLIRRLSADDAFRNSLVQEAQTQQEHLDKKASESSTDKAAGSKPPEDAELIHARAVRDEIQANLATLRAPSLAVMPDHFLWQKMPMARMPRDLVWKKQLAPQYELVTGNASFTIVPQWHEDLLADLEAAIDASGAPVSARLAHDGVDVVLESVVPRSLTLRVAGDEEPALLEPVATLAQASLMVSDFAKDEDFRADAHMQLNIDSAPHAIDAGATPAGDALTRLAGRLAKSAATLVTVTRLGKNGQPDDKGTSGLRLTAKDPAARQIALLRDKDEPFSNVLRPTSRVPTGWRLRAAQANRLRAGNLRVSVDAVDYTIPGGGWQQTKGTPAVVDMPALAVELNKTLQKPEKISARVHSADTLVLTARRLGKLELRTTPGKAESNLLGAAEAAPWSATVSELIASRAFPGMILSWMLLSLGAPFWYDTLKNLLKLRPAPAVAEEAHRNDRAKQTPAGAATTEKTDKK